jgi:PEGA domain
MKARSSWQGSRWVAATSASGAVAAILLVLLVLACGQEDPSFRPDGGGSAEKGAIDVSSSVPGARISLDGVDTGRITPDTLDAVDPGTHRVSVLLAGFYQPAEQTVEVIADQVHSLSFELAAIPMVGRIAVTAPYPAGILLDGSPTGSACPDTVEGVAPGAHTVAIVLPGFASDPASIQVDVVAGETVTADFAMRVPKLVVCEDFSNYACIPCPPADAALQQAVSEVGGERVITVNPHTFFPALGDPFYQFNLGANRARIFFNQVQVAPTILVDGTRVPQTEVNSPAAIRSRIEAVLASPVPIALGVEGDLTATTYAMTVDVWGIASDIPANLLLFVWVVEGDVTLVPAGPNGQSHYKNVLRHLFPTPESPNGLGGLALGAIAPGERRTYAFTYDLPPGDAVNPQELRAVAFAQEESGGRRVVQTGISAAAP